MKKTELTLDIQSYVDGELPPERRAQVEAALVADADAERLAVGLRRLGVLLRSNEPDIRVPDSREFYWSQVRRRIEASRGADAPGAGDATAALGWLRWLVPAMGVAAVAVIVSLPRRGEPAEFAGLAYDATQTEATSVVFRSESDGVTVHWIQ
jgi:anti-sigma factor RsiW